MELLTGQGRIGRLGYFLTSVVLVLATALAVVALAETDPVTGDAEFTGLGFVAVIVGSWLHLMNARRRLRDLGHGWVWLLLILVPVIGWALSLYLLFAPGIPAGAYVGPRRGPTNPLTGEPVMTERQARKAYEARNRQLTNDDGSFDMDGLWRDSPIRRS